MTSHEGTGRSVTIPARDGYPLAARIFGPPSRRVVVINGATAVPQRFYRHFAAALATMPRRPGTPLTPTADPSDHWSAVP